MKINEHLIMQMYTDMYTTVSLYEYGLGYLVKAIRSGELISFKYLYRKDEAIDYFKQVVVSHFTMHILHTQEILNHISQEIHAAQYNVLIAKKLEDAYNSVCNPKFANTLRNLKEELSDWLGTILNWGVNGKNSLDTIEENDSSTPTNGSRTED